VLVRQYPKNKKPKPELWCLLLLRCTFSHHGQRQAAKGVLGCTEPQNSTGEPWGAVQLTQRLTLPPPPTQEDKARAVALDRMDPG
jgi:hypothetical protein